MLIERQGAGRGRRVESEPRISRAVGQVGVFVGHRLHGQPRGKGDASVNSLRGDSGLMFPIILRAAVTAKEAGPGLEEASEDLS